MSVAFKRSKDDGSSKEDGDGRRLDKKVSNENLEALDRVDADDDPGDIRDGKTTQLESNAPENEHRIQADDQDGNRSQNPVDSTELRFSQVQTDSKSDSGKPDANFEDQTHETLQREADREMEGESKTISSIKSKHLNEL